MSGIEIAGLVLASIPLLVSALEHHSDGVQTIRKIRHSSKGFLRLKRILETENDIFLNSIELLLKDDVDDHVLATMLQYPGSKDVGWKDVKLDARLRERLGRSYSIYFEAVDALANDIRSFADAIQLNDSGKAPFTLDAWSVKDALSRIRFGLKMKGYNDIVNDITAQNQRIMWLTQQGNLLEPLRKRRRKLPDFDTARAHARAVFEAIRNGLPSTCIVGH
ncbi:hypothetical protein CBER1_05566 [Cercospora berteroae]|uniref:Prion-inhibition and propagation HeLo domain-containing protein n=1 Tax=Cercospora berteroae TaxID=357750 RepID=A0A2S6BSL0_9PEZI|nr:hypothetical protein CBER1_05566 [Cercospora berteroae]